MCDLNHQLNINDIENNKECIICLTNENYDNSIRDIKNFELLQTNCQCNYNVHLQCILQTQNETTYQIKCLMCNKIIKISDDNYTYQIPIISNQHTDVEPNTSIYSRLITFFLCTLILIIVLSLLWQ